MEKKLAESRRRGTGTIEPLVVLRAAPYAMMTMQQDHPTSPVVIAGQLDIDCANEFRDALVERLRRPPSALSLDLSGVGKCDATTIQILVAALRDAAKAGADWRLGACSPEVIDTAAELGVQLPYEGDQ